MQELTNEQTQSVIRADPDKVVLSVVVPVYNEAEVLPEFHKRFSAVVESLRMDIEIV